MDAAGYIADNLQHFHEHKRYIIIGVPQQIKEAKECLQSVDIEGMTALGKGV